MCPNVVDILSDILHDREMKNISTSDVIGWLREQARLFNQMADTIQSTFQVSQGISAVNGQQTLPNLGTITVEKIREAVSQKAMRTATLAAQFSVPEYDVQKVLDSPDSGLKKGKQGWITLEDKPLLR